MEEKINIKGLMEMYDVTDRTISNWIKQKNLPMIEITPQQKWIYKDDLIEWERSFIKNDTRLQKEVDK